MEPLIIVPLC